MTHEFKEILQAYVVAQAKGASVVLATLVSVNGSSYRKEGVRMLIHKNQQIVGAISGGCVEKEVIHQSKSVFSTGKSKVITYDGRYRLGCEGTLYILLEKLNISDEIVFEIENVLNNRVSFELLSYYTYRENFSEGVTFVKFSNGKEYSLSINSEIKTDDYECFQQLIPPMFQLYIIGVEHDANALSQQASLLGWEINIVNSSKLLKTTSDFKEAKRIINTEAGVIDDILIDKHTAIVLMNHSYAKDFLFLKSLKETAPVYIGLLGAKKRKEQLFNALIEEDWDMPEAFLDLIYGPTGLDIGAITPQEIAVAIVSEIISVVRNKKKMYLEDVCKTYNSNF